MRFSVFRGPVKFKLLGSRPRIENGGYDTTVLRAGVEREGRECEVVLRTMSSLSMSITIVSFDGTPEACVRFECHGSNDRLRRSNDSASDNGEVIYD